MLVILDRDGVINKDSPSYIKSPAEWTPIRGSLEAIVKLKRAGATVVVCTNQSGIARGLLTTETLQRIHLQMQQQLNELGADIDAIYHCPHHPQDNCECRKPRPGLLLRALRQHSKAREPCFFIGDSLSDVKAAAQTRCYALLVRTGNGAETERLLPPESKPAVFDDLLSAAEWVIKTK